MTDENRVKEHGCRKTENRFLLLTVRPFTAIITTGSNIISLLVAAVYLKSR